MASIDERVVAMAFENAKFEAGVAQTMLSLSKLNDTIAKVGAVEGFSNIEKASAKVTLQAPMSALDKLKARLGLAGQGAAEGFGQIEQSSNKVSLSGAMNALDKIRIRIAGVGNGSAEAFGAIEKSSNKVTLEGVGRALDSVTAKFSVLEGAAAVALGNIVTKAALAGAQLAKSLSLGPVTQGFQEYSTNLQSIQTILANTKASGANLQDVNKALQELNKYSDQTIYNFSEMAKNIGTFTAAGVDLDKATASIKGIANLAALSGSSSEQASTAMYQLSQAIAAGRVSLQDWNSVVNAGMGGATFQRALANTAEHMGTLNKGAVELKGKMKNVTIEGQSFRESITAKPGEKSWLTSDVLTKTLAQFTGDLSAADLAAQGYNKSQIAAIQQTAKTAKEAATQVKTITQVWDVAKETLGSGWATTFQNIFGNFNEAKTLFTGLSNTINGFINTNSKARNAVLSDWKELGGRTDLIKGIKAVFEDLISVVKPIKDAFREIFPAKTGKDLAEMTKHFREFAESMKLSPESADTLKRVMAGLFAVIHIGTSTVKEIVLAIGKLIGVTGEGSKGFQNFAGGVGDFLVAIDKALTKGGALHSFFQSIATVIEVPIRLLGVLSGAIFGLFDHVDSSGPDKFGKSMGGLKDSLGPAQKIIDTLSDAWERMVKVLHNVKESVQPILDNIMQSINLFADSVKHALKTADWDNVFAGLQTGILGGIFIALKKALGGDAIGKLGGGLLGNLSGVFKGLTGNLEAMQKNIQAHTLLAIAGAIGVLAASVTVLSQVDGKKLTKAMTAISVGLGELIGALALLSKVGGKGAFVTMPIMATGLIALAGAMVILAGAVKLFSTMDWEELARGLAGVAGGLGALALGTKLIGPGVASTAIAILPLAIGMNILAIAVKQFASIPWSDLAKGIGGVGLSLTAMGLGLKTVGPEVLLIAPGLIGVAFAMNLLAAAIKSFGDMKLSTLAKGITAVGASLGVIGLAVALIPPTIALQAAGLVLMGVALTGIAGAIKLLGSMDLGKLAKGLASVAGILAVLALGLSAMTGTLLGSAAVLVAAGAFAILAPVMAVLGNLKWGTILKGLAAMAAILGTLAAVGALVAEPLAILGVALLPLAGAMVVAAGSIYLFAKALQVLSGDGTKGIAVMVASVTAFLAVLPKIIIQFVKGLVEIVQEIAKIAPQITESVVKILDQIIEVVIRSTPKLAEAITVFVSEFVQVIRENAGPIVAAGFFILLAFLSGIKENIGQVAQHAIDIVVKFIETMAANIDRIVASGATFLVNWLNGIADKLPQVLESGAHTLKVFLEGVAREIPGTVAKAAQTVNTFLNSVAAQLPKIIDSGAKVVIGFLKGLEKSEPKIVAQAVKTIGAYIRAIGEQSPKLVDAGFDAVIDFLHGIADVIRNKTGPVIDAGFDIGAALLEGLVKALKEKAGDVYKQIKKIADKLTGPFKKILEILSPSRVFYGFGEMIIAGLVNGLSDGHSDVINTVADTANVVKNTAAKMMATVPAALDGMMDMDPVITPVLDLSAVKKEAANMSLGAQVIPITAASSYGQATAISQEKTASDVQTAAALAPSREFKFEQNNYSPESLSDVEIYRQTKNQLSQVKTALGMT